MPYFKTIADSINTTALTDMLKNQDIKGSFTQNNI